MDYVTVVSVDNGANLNRLVDDSHSNIKISEDNISQDSQFITVLAIGDSLHQPSTISSSLLPPELVLVYRLPGERLGFGLKFQGGTKSNEKIQRLFIQSCAPDSPASRANASWGHLREGDEILEIDGTSVDLMTRIECVKCLKESNVAIKLLVRNGEGKMITEFFDDITIDNKTGEKRNPVPPPPPPVPPRKLNKRKQDIQHFIEIPTASSSSTKIFCNNDNSFTPPPDAEFYINLFSEENDNNFRGSESDDTGSTISTVIDKYSTTSSLSEFAIDSITSNNITATVTTSTTVTNISNINNNNKSTELAKVLKPFTLLEKEFNVESNPKFEDCLLRLQPPINFQDEQDKQQQQQMEKTNSQIIVVHQQQEEDEHQKIRIINEPVKDYENVIVKVDGPPSSSNGILYENVKLKLNNEDIKMNNYENIDFKVKSDERNYENVMFTEQQQKVPPKPLPRQGITLTIEPKKRTILPPTDAESHSRDIKKSMTITTATGATTSSSITSSINSEFTTIHNWLQDTSSDVHECAIVTDENGNEGEIVIIKNQTSSPSSPPSVVSKEEKDVDENLPRLVNFLPKDTITPNKSKQQNNNYNEDEDENEDDDDDGDDAYEDRDQVDGIKPIIKQCIKITTSSAIDDDDDDDAYMESSSDEDVEKVYEPILMEKRDSSDGYSDEDGEKLGPPELLAGPGPSEAYFNFHWGPTMLPTIGEVEEELSSLEPQTGPIVIINDADDTPPTPTTTPPAAAAAAAVTATLITTTKPIYSENAKLTNNAASDKSILSEMKNIQQNISTDHKIIPVIDKVSLEKNPLITTTHSQMANRNKISDKISTSSSSPPPPPLQPLSSPSPPTITTTTKTAIEVDVTTVIINSVPDANKLRDYVASSDKNSQKKINNNSKETTTKKKLISQKNQEIISTTSSTTINITSGNKSVNNSYKNKNKNNIISDSDTVTHNSINIIGKICEKPITSDNNVNDIVVNANHDNNKVEKIVDKKIERIILGIEHSKGDEKEINKKINKMESTILTENSSSEKRNSQGNNDDSTSSVTVISDDMERTVGILSIGDTTIAPPTFSRLPPDGHEFPPNFSEPSVMINSSSVKMAEIKTTTATTTPINNINNKHNSFLDDAPPLPKSIPPAIPSTPPPTVPRKIYRQDLVIKVDDTRQLENNNINISSGNKNNNNNGKPIAAMRREIIDESVKVNSKQQNGHQKDRTDRSLESLSLVELRRKSIENNTSVVDSPRKFSDNISLTPSSRKTMSALNWRKDEKSEKSVRDKIAMFSNPDTATPANDVKKSLNKSTDNLLSDRTDFSSNRKFSDSYAKKARSVENLDDYGDAVTSDITSRVFEPIEKKYNNFSSYQSSPPLPPTSSPYSIESNNKNKSPIIGKAQSVENLDYENKYLSRTTTNSTVVPSSVSAVPMPKERHLIQHQQSTPVPNYASLPRRSGAPTLSRTISFSGYGSNQNSEDRRRNSITHLLEQRKKSMSKLRGLVIPEKAAGIEIAAEPVLFDLPEIKSKELQKVASVAPLTTSRYSVPVVPRTIFQAPERKISLPQSYTIVSTTPSASLGESTYKSIFEGTRRPLTTSLGIRGSLLNGTNSSSSSSIASNKDNDLLGSKSSATLPPIKPPRTSLILASRSSSLEGGKILTTDDSGEDSDSVLSSRIYTPPGSPLAPNNITPEKFPLSRTLSSETNTSIASSTTSTLTSGSGSQASCSSLGSTPALDMKRKVLKSSSAETSVNRKNILASAKSRSGRGEDGGPRQSRYEDEDSTDGNDEEEFKRPKPKLRSSLSSSNGKMNSSGSERSQQLINYKLVDENDSLVDRVINVATFVEVVSDTEEIGKTLMDMVLIETTNTFIVEEKNIAVPVFVQDNTKSSSASTKIDNKHKKKNTSPDDLSDNVNSGEMNDLAKWVRKEAAKTKTITESTTPNKPTELPVTKQPYRRSISDKLTGPLSPKPTEEVFVPRTVPKSMAEQKKLTPSDIRKQFEIKSNGNVPSPIRTPITPTTPIKEKTINNYHDRFSSWESVASNSSSGVSSMQTTSGLSGGSQTLQSTPTDFGSFSSLGSSHSLITAQDLQFIIEEAEPPLQAPEAFIVVLQRESLESSIGMTLAGGADYEAKEITIHKILLGSPADKDGRLKRGDRILAINGLSMRGLTHKESVTVLKTPRTEVVVVVTRSASVTVAPLSKTKRSSLGSLTSLNEKGNGDNGETKLQSFHKASRSLDLDIMMSEGDVSPPVQEKDEEEKEEFKPAAGGPSNDNKPQLMGTSQKTDNNNKEIKAVMDVVNQRTDAVKREIKSTLNGKTEMVNSKQINDTTMTKITTTTTTTSSSASTPPRRQRASSREETTSMTSTPNKASSATTKPPSSETSPRKPSSPSSFVKLRGIPRNAREVEIIKDGCGLGFSIEGGYDSPLGNRPLLVKKVFMGGAAEKAGNIKNGDEIIGINGFDTATMTRVDAWNYMKKLPLGPVKIILL